MKNLTLLRGPLLLLLYQTAPVAVRQDSLGRYRLTLGAAGGQWENAEFSCDGSLLSTTPVRYRAVGIQLDQWAAPHVRLTAFGGATGQTVGVTEATEPGSSDPYIESFDGAFGGVQLAYEGQHLGAGFGVTRVPGVNGFVAPAPYLRFGNMDGAHFRLEVLSPNPAFPTSGWGRAGVGFNKGHLRGTSGFVGLAIGPVDYDSKLALTGEVGVPMHGRMSGQFQGLLGPGERLMQWNAGVGLRIDFGH
jgi:hypothetical protein